MGRTSLPPGFRFHPNDTELILYYLKRKVLGKPLRIQAVKELDLYKFAPWDLPDKSCLKSSDLEWYFFCPRDKKYTNGPRVNRSTEIGFWKTTGKERAIYNDRDKVGIKKTLIFHLGRAPQGTRTNWVMHEYRLEIKDWSNTGISQDSYVLCRIFEKSGAGPKNGEQRGAPFKEEEWEDNLVDISLMPLPLLDCASSSVVSVDDKIIATADETLVLGQTSDTSMPTPCQNASSDACREKPSLLEDSNMDSLLAILGEVNDFSHREKHSSLEAADMDSLLAILDEENDVGHNLNDVNQMPDSLNYGCNVKAPTVLGGSDVFGALDNLNTRTKLNGNDNLDPTDVEGDYGSGQTLPGDSVTYMELNDLDCAMKYPLRIDDPKVIQYGDFRSRLEIGCTDSFGLHNSPLPEKNAFPVGLNENFAEEYPSLGKLENVTSEGHICLDHYDCVGDLPRPFVSSKANHLASEVVSSQSMLLQNSAVLLENKDVALDVCQDHIGFRGIALPNYEDGRQVPEFHLGGNRQTENDKNSSQAFSRGSFPVTWLWCQD